MKEPISIAIMTYSGDERPNTPVKSCDRVRTLLESIIKNSLIELPRIVVVDDGSDNVEAQKKVEVVCKIADVEYYVNPKWGGVSGNYNFGVEKTDTDLVIMLSDDQYVSKNWLSPMFYFLDNNPEIKIGMAGFNVIFSYELTDRFCILGKKEDFYTTNLLKDIADNFDKYADVILGNTDIVIDANPDTFENFKKVAQYGKWFNPDKPRIRGHSSGSAFVLRRDLWTQFGGFYPNIYQPDEDYGDNVWNMTDYLCVQVPTYPIFHYESGSSFGEHCESDLYKNCADNWKKRPFMKDASFELRGGGANKKMCSLVTDPLENCKFIKL